MEQSQSVRQALTTLRTYLQDVVSPYPQISAEDVKVLTRDAEVPATARGPVVESVPRSLRLAAAVSWRSLIVLVGLMTVAFLAYQLSIIVIPLLLSMLFAVLLEPLLRLFIKLRFGRTLAAVAALLIGLGLVIGLVWLASTQIIAGIEDLWSKAELGLGRAVAWLWDGPLQLDQQAVLQYWAEMRANVGEMIQNNKSALASGALTVTSSLGTLFTGVLLILFCVFFFLKDGRTIWQWFVRLLPKGARHPVNEAAIRGWFTLGSYARTQALVAFIDAFFIGLGAMFLGVPLWFPLSILVFLGSFIPIVGAILTGMIAVLVALVDQGLTVAIIMAVIILIVQQLEGNVLNPMLMSNAVNLHPIAVLLAVTAGGYWYGIIGAMFSVPLAAFLNTSFLYFYGYDNAMRLNYDRNRPGGPPGTLDDEIAASLRPSEANLAEAEKMRRRYAADQTTDLGSSGREQMRKADRQLAEARVTARETDEKMKRALDQEGTEGARKANPMAAKLEESEADSETD